MNPHHVKLRDLAQEGAENAAVEVLVGQETQHGLTSQAGKEAVAQAGLRGVSLDLAADLFRPGSPLAKVGIHFGAMPQVVGDDRVDIGKPKDREVLSDLLGGCAGHEGVHHRIQGDPGSRDTDSSVGIR